MKGEFVESIQKHQEAFGLNLSDEKIDALADYYKLVRQHNPLLHLVAPSSPEEFAVRHILESIPLQRMANADEVAEVVAFLAGERSSYVNGQAINVCGGIEMD